MNKYYIATFFYFYKMTKACINIAITLNGKIKAKYECN